MRLARYTTQHGGGVGVAVGDSVHPTPFATLQDVIAAGVEGLERVRAATQTDPVEPTRLLAPLQPRQVICCGINYASHLDENPGATIPSNPFLFAKLPSSVIGPGEPIVIPEPESEVDYEVELTVVIGRTMRKVRPEDALKYVFGYTLVNDVSGRDIQFVDHQITLGKSIDTFCPVGPTVTTADAVDHGSIELSTVVNGEVRQRGSTAEHFFDVPKLLSFVSAFITLQPGDLVTTGTPAGVGAFRDPPAYLRPGDIVTVAAEGIGELTNPVVAGWV